ncbi:FtsX-like permease family protein [Modestobacter italicus]|uniref:FtsX-like permease family protein n=1 Tax=Modestobacter italicus (strain DSM 44449 / CECT 9708 / BC 501) TaxID=2732864 RepID=UPI001C978E69|nr:FtsX-like permease family protein [Modestobacter italicus]
MSRPQLWRLAPWTRAPLLGLRQPAAVLAVLVTSAILACAVASAPLFLSSARSAALQQQLAQRCDEVARPQTGVSSSLVDEQLQPLDGGDGSTRPAADDQFLQAWADAGMDPEPVLATAWIGSSGPFPYSAAPVSRTDGSLLSTPISLFHRPAALEHVEVVERGDGPGVWVPQTLAEQEGLAVGDVLTFGSQSAPVAGIHRDLAVANADDPYWCDYRLLFSNETSANVPPPAMLLTTDEPTFYRLATAAVGYATRLQQVPVDAASLSVSDARDQLDTQQRIVAASGLPLPSRGSPEPVVAVPNDRLPDVLDRATLIESGLRGPVVPVAVAGALLALVLVAAAGSFWADRRATEVRLLAARGVGPAPLAGKAALELALPALAGAALGWAASRLLIAGLGPADDLDPSATTAAAWAGVAAFVVGLGAASAVAGLRARGTAERPLGAAPRWPARVPWELALLLGAAWCWLLLQTRDAVVSVGFVAQVNGLLVAFPLLAIAGTAIVLGRLVTALLPRLRRWAGRRSPAVFLAANRLTAARLATGTLLVAVTLPVAVLGYTATLTASSQTTLDAKVGVQIGAAAAATTVTRFEVTPAIEAAGTYLVRYDGSAEAADDAGRTDVQVLAVDPDDFADTAFWDDSFADRSLPELLAALTGPEVDGRLPIVAAGLPAGDPNLRLGSTSVPAEVTATARVLPGRRSDDPVVLVDAGRLPEITRNAGAAPAAELWTNDDLGAGVDALADAGAQNIRLLTPEGVQESANFLGITWTFGYLSALAVFVGVIAVGGLLLYLEARSRTRVAGYVMARRLGLTRAAHLRSLLVELIGVAVAGVLLGGVLAAGAVALVYRRLDVDQVRPPTPLLDVPWPALGLSAVVVVVVAGLAALYAQRAADRADPATVLRQEA